jgi:c-di-GMP-binding flagellar brake protein YcgR
MIELRRNPRANVIWRAVIKTGEGKAVGVKIVNISNGGLLLHCPSSLEINKAIHLMMEIPSIDQTSSIRYQVPCKVLVMHVRLSGDIYQVGVKFTEISELHQSLFDAWLSIIAKFERLE